MEDFIKEVIRKTMFIRHGFFWVGTFCIVVGLILCVVVTFEISSISECETLEFTLGNAKLNIKTSLPGIILVFAGVIVYMILAFKIRKIKFVVDGKETGVFFSLTDPTNPLPVGDKDKLAEFVNKIADESNVRKLNDNDFDSE